MVTIPKRCGYAFICSIMTGAPDAEQCPNYEECKGRTSYSDSEAAEILLMQRGCHTPATELLDQLNKLTDLIMELTTMVDAIDRSEYIPPLNCEVHRYNVKRPKGVFEYYKLAAREEIFQGVKKELTKVIHLGKAENELHLVASAAVERRNLLNRLHKDIKRYAIELEIILTTLKK